MIQKVIQKGSDILTKKCALITDFKQIQATIVDLVDTIAYLKTTHEFRRGIGLAAPQIGKCVQLSVVQYNGDQYVLINPEITKTSEERKPIREGCISFLQYRAMVPRFTYVKVKAYDKNGNEYFIEGKDDFAMLLQHEIDHLNGKLYTSYLKNGEKDLQKID